MPNDFGRSAFGFLDAAEKKLAAICTTITIYHYSADLVHQIMIAKKLATRVHYTTFHY